MSERIIRTACDIRTILVLVAVFALLLACGCATHWTETLAPGRSIIVWPNGHIEDGPAEQPTPKEDPFAGIDMEALGFPRPADQ